jgi:hypothetical protein
MSEDDTYQKFQCGGDFWSKYHINVLYVDSGNLLLGVARCLAFMMFLCFQWYNKVLLDRKQANNVNVIKGLILPSYLPFIYFYMLFSMCTGLIDLINQATYKSEEFDSWVYPIEIGITHWFLEGLAIFLMRYGAGVQAIRRSLRISFMWGIFTTFWFIIIFSILYNRFRTDHVEDKIYAMFIAYAIILFCFYAAYAVVPSKYLYHRPALRFYARFNTISTGIVICFASLYHCGVYTIICPGSMVAFIFAAFLQPLAIFKTLQIDSQYWQGLSPEQGNPLTEVWDHLGIETASSMAENLEQFGRINRKLPILHFGLMNFDTDLKFVAGGFSRVYFGTLRGERVAFKILFAMELDPKDVEEFYREAAVLHTLKHANVVKCLGVCVMPPALAIVLELCKYGSLFDFLHKPVTAPPPPKNRHSLSSLIRTSLIGTRNSLIGAPPPQDLEFSHNGGSGPHFNAGNMSAGLELRSLEPEPSFSAPTGKITDGACKYHIPNCFCPQFADDRGRQSFFAQFAIFLRGLADPKHQHDGQRVRSQEPHLRGHLQPSLHVLLQPQRRASQRSQPAGPGVRLAQYDRQSRLRGIQPRRGYPPLRRRPRVHAARPGVPRRQPR